MKAAFCLVLLSLVAHCLAQACTGTVVAVEQPSEWEESYIPKHIFQLQITNKDATCTMRDSIKLTISHPPGTTIGHVWGVSPAGVATIPAITPGQTYSGAGFVFSGAGKPTVSIASVANCDCGSSSANPTTGTPSDTTTGIQSSTTGTTPTDAPTSAPTDTPTSAPTTAPTDAPTSAPTATPTQPSNLLHVNMRYLVLGKNEIGIVNLTFNSVGAQFDLLDVTAATDLSTVLSTSGVGKYAGIVVTKPIVLSNAQEALLLAYQTHYGVKSAHLGSSPAKLPGFKANAASSALGTLTLAPEGYKIATPLQHTISLDNKKGTAWNTGNPATFTSATITNTSIASPVVYINGNQVIIATLKVNNTQQLHYFIDLSETLMFARTLSPILLNWLSPGGIYMGLRRHTLAVQPDDLFMNSFLWDVKTHKNPLSQNLTYRITPDDLQKAADYFAAVKNDMVAGSYVTVEWPYNGAGTIWYQPQPDPLLAKAIQLQDSFYFVSHTWSHPCDFDTANYTSVFNELKNNIDWVNTGVFLTGNMLSPRLAPDSLVNPCITGLFNGQALQAMNDNGIKYCVGDNSVAKLVPENKYHGIHTTVATHGFAGMFIIPREAYDIDYDNSVPAELVDQFNTAEKKNMNFEEIMDLQVDYAMEKKTAFRQDAYMFHQANLRFFSYDDPVAGKTHDVSLVTLWMDRVIRKTTSYYNLPIVSPMFPDMAQLWLDREDMDKCGLSIDLSITEGKLYAITLTSATSCKVSLSGVQLSGCTTETAGAEVTSFINMAAGVPQTFTLPTPVDI